MTVYFYDFSEDPHTLIELKPLLGEQRYEYCADMKSEVAGLRSAYAFLLLRYALGKEFGITAMPVFELNEHGKPFLKDRGDVFFSMSHSGKCAVCAVSESPIGTDIQDIRPIKLNTGIKFLTESECSYITAISDENERHKEMSRIWCIKESYSKMTGKGFGEGFTGIDTEKLLNSGRAYITMKNEYWVSVCR